MGLHRTVVRVARAMPAVVASVALTVVAGGVPAAGAASTSTTLTAAADTYVSESAPSTTSGTRRRLVVSEDPASEAFVTFDLGAYDGGIDTATLRLHPTRGKATGTSRAAVSGSSDTQWVETTITKSSLGPRIDGASWAHRPEIDGESFGTLTATDDGWLEVDVTPLVAASADGKVTFAITAEQGTSTFDSRESGAGAPRLVVTSGAPAAEVTGVAVAAVGDAACPDGTPKDAAACHQMAMSDLILEDADATTLLMLGDLAYEHGELANFRTAYEKSYGRLKDKTKPVPGNHEYDTPGAAGYYTYWGATAGDPTTGYYSFDVGPSWHVVALNSNCSFVACDAGSAQEQWLREDLAASSAPCTIAYWHHPRFSSSVHGDEATVQPLWDALDQAGADLVLNGHDHIYERFDPQTGSGVASPDGLREITVGTGGVDLYPVISEKPNSVVRISNFGYLQLTLGSDAYSWRFVTEDRRVLDSGTAACV